MCRQVNLPKFLESANENLQTPPIPTRHPQPTPWRQCRSIPARLNRRALGCLRITASSSGFNVAPLGTSSKISRADILIGLVLRGVCPGIETPITPDGPDVLDANPYPAMPWGGWLGDGFVECAWLFGGVYQLSVCQQLGRAISRGCLQSVQSWTASGSR